MQRNDYKAKISEAIELCITLFPFMDEKASLALRSTCKAFQDAAKQSAPVPCVSKAQFAMAMGAGLTKNKEEGELANVLAANWELYARTINSASMQPAMLYRLKDKDSKDFEAKVTKFADGEDLLETGRVYTPYDIYTEDDDSADDPHYWEKNLRWMSAQIHKKRAFCILSAPTKENLYRDNDGVYSAFAKEIAVAMKAGYYLAMSAKHGLTLQPPNKAVEVEFVVITKDEIESFYRQVRLFEFQQRLKFKQTLSFNGGLAQLYRRALAADAAKKQSLQLAINTKL